MIDETEDQVTNAIDETLIFDSEESSDINLEADSNESENRSAERKTAPSLGPLSVNPTHLVVLVGLAVLPLATSVVLQALTLSHMQRQPTAFDYGALQSTEEKKTFRDSVPLVRLAPWDTVDVAINDTVDVAINDISTLDELRVNLYNHRIISGDPIPVEIVR